VRNEMGGENMRPLDGIKVVEMAGLAPSPYCGMILADFGAEVVVVDRLSKGGPEMPNIMAKNLGPDEALKVNPRLIYARLTGWGQEGPYAGMAGHDINYIGLSGALSLFRRKGERPLPPCNLLGDFAGGGMLCAMGIFLALIERSRSGKGQVVDAAMVDGAANLATLFYGLLANHLMTLDIGTNMLDSGAPYYQTYETADGKYMAVGAIEARFYEELLKGLNVEPSSLPAQNDWERWPEMTATFGEIFRTKTRDEWTAIFEGKDACVAPVLGLDEVDQHPHNRERGLLSNLDGALQPLPAPRLSRTPGRAQKPGKPRGSETADILKELGYSARETEALNKDYIVE
jgi:alpha-methylacyl-CoA racemase